MGWEFCSELRYIGVSESTNKTKENIMNVTLKSIKVAKFASEETLCFEANIYVDGKKIGVAYNEGHGGCNGYHFTDKAAGKAFHAYCESIPSTYGIPSHPMADADELIDRLVNEFESNKDFKRWCRTKVCFRLTGDDKNAWRTIGYGGRKALTAEQVNSIRANITAKYGNKIEEVLNDRFAA